MNNILFKKEEALYTIKRIVFLLIHQKYLRVANVGKKVPNTII